MRNKKGFTLIEVLSVIIIIGIIMLIAIPAVGSYIDKSNKGAYASDAQAYLETIKSEYTMKDYGELLEGDELLIVPIDHIDLEKGDTGSSPYGPYDYSRCYVFIVPERNGYQYYITLVDETGVGIIQKPDNELGRNAVQEDITDSVPTFESYAMEDLTFKGKNYKYLGRRSISSIEKSVEDALIVLQEE